MTAEKIKEIVSQMTLEEKASMCSGADFWHTEAVARLGIPASMVSDGPHGLRKQDQEGDHLGVNDSIKAVCFPAGCGTAASFNRELIQQMGETLGEECQAEGVSVILGPAVNIKRSPLCGRNFEYYSEDPLVSGMMAGAETRGVQETPGIGACLKHFALNNQEASRNSSNSVASERTMREIYLKGFQIAWEESKPQAIMSTYGPINGIWTAGNYDLLTTVLRKEWGYDGLVMTDWWSRMNEEGNPASEKNTTVMIQAQNDLYMVVEDSLSNSKGDNTMEGINAGKINRGELVRNAANICRVLIRMGS